MGEGKKSPHIVGDEHANIPNYHHTIHGFALY